MNITISALGCESRNAFGQLGDAAFRAARLGALVCLCAAAAAAQSSSSAPELSHRPASALSSSPESATLALSVPKGIPLQVVLDKEVHIRKVGQPINGHVVEPIYAFDKLVIPVGTAVSGQITKIETLAVRKRALAALDADFTPTRKIEVEFTSLVLPGGKQIPINTIVTPSSGQVARFVSAAESADEKKGVKDAAAENTAEAKRQAHQAWDSAMKQVEQPGKVHRVERYAVAQLPIHPQYVDAGSMYFAELQEPLDFGVEPMTRALASSIGSAPPEGAVVHARLLTPLSSALASKGDDVEAVITQPLFDKNRLILPQGSMMKGSVIQVQPARLMSRNGELRFVFHDLVLPDGVEQKVDAVLQGVQSGKADNVKLDSEGGAKATTPKTRYLQTAVSLGLAAVSLGGDADSKVANPAGNTSNRVAGGAGGFKLVGMVLGVAVKSRAFGYSMGAYGAGMSIYTHFIARGRDVVFPKNTAMEIGVSTRTPASTPSAVTNQ